MTRVFVVSKLAHDVMETKPGVGVFVIPAGGEVELFDIPGEHKLPDNIKVPYVKHKAVDIARSLVQDYKSPGLEMVLREEEEKVEIVEIVSTDEIARVEPSEVGKVEEKKEEIVPAPESLPAIPEGIQ